MVSESENESESDDLFVYPGRLKIQEACIQCSL